MSRSRISSLLPSLSTLETLSYTSLCAYLHIAAYLDRGEDYDPSVIISLTTASKVAATLHTFGTLCKIGANFELAGDKFSALTYKRVSGAAMAVSTIALGGAIGITDSAIDLACTLTNVTFNLFGRQISSQHHKKIMRELDIDFSPHLNNEVEVSDNNSNSPESLVNYSPSKFPSLSTLETLAYTSLCLYIHISAYLDRGEDYDPSITVSLTTASKVATSGLHTLGTFCKIADNFDEAGQYSKVLRYKLFSGVAMGVSSVALSGALGFTDSVADLACTITNVSSNFFGRQSSSQHYKEAIASLDINPHHHPSSDIEFGENASNVEFSLMCNSPSQ